MAVEVVQRGSEERIDGGLRVLVDLGWCRRERRRLHKVVNDRS